MAIADVLVDSANVSALIEVITLFFIVAGFFRWYDSRYQRTMVDTRDEIMERITTAQQIVCERIERLDREIMRLDDRFHKHLEDHHHEP